METKEEKQKNWNSYSMMCSCGGFHTTFEHNRIADSERERCAKIADSYAACDPLAAEIAKKIRSGE